MRGKFVMFKDTLVAVLKALYRALRRYVAKNKYLAAFSAVVLVLALVRLFFPSVANGKKDVVAVADTSKAVSQPVEQPVADSLRIWQQASGASAEFPLTYFFDDKGRQLKHRINSVPGFSRTFPDNNDVQLLAASTHGVEPVADRRDAEKRKKELVFVGASPYFHVDPLHNSIPYLVPRAAVLLNDIGRAYYDSLQIKGIPLHQIIVTSVLRSRVDVKKLRGYNPNATENSCHLYGTTFDICYNRYKTVSPFEGRPRRAVRNDTLKWVLSEVLRDMREKKRCYVKYEVKQGCFHITVR